MALRGTFSQGKICQLWPSIWLVLHFWPISSRNYPSYLPLKPLNYVVFLIIQWSTYKHLAFGSSICRANFIKMPPLQNNCASLMHLESKLSYDLGVLIETPWGFGTDRLLDRQRSNLNPFTDHVFEQRISKWYDPFNIHTKNW